MKKLMIGAISLLTVIMVNAQADGQANRELVIYKWVQDGVTFYAHILPNGINDYVKLDAEGFLLEDLPDENADLNGLLRPDSQSKNVESAKKRKKKDEEDENLTEEEKAEALLKKKNCEALKDRGQKLQGEQAIIMTNSGAKVLEGEELEKEREKNKKDVDYFCSD